MLGRPWFPWKLLAIALASGPLLLLAVVRAPTIPDSDTHVDVDGSAFTSLAYRLERGSLSGREFEHTYGVLGQALARLWASLHEPGDAASSLPLIMIGFWTLNVMLLATLLLLLPALGAWESAAILLLLAHLEIPFHYPSFRPLAAMIAVALMAHACSAPARPARLWLATTAAAACLAAQLLTTEAGVYALAACVGVPLVAWRFAKDEGGAQRRADAECLAVLVGVEAVLQGALAWTLSATSGGRGLLDYHHGLLRVLSGYPLALGRAWSLPFPSTWCLAAAVLLTLGIALARARRESPLGRRLLLGLALVAVFHAKGTLTRPDVGHVMLALTPFVVLWALLLPDWRRPRLAAAAWIGALAALEAAWPADAFVAGRYALAMARGERTVADAWRQARRFRIAEERLLPLGLLRSLRARGGPLLAIPYQNHLAMALGRPLPGGVHQAYSAYTLDLQRELLDAVERAGPGLDVVYGVDGLTGAALDGVEVPTRLPLVFERLAEGFRAGHPLLTDRGFFRLERRPVPRPLQRRRLEGSPARGEPQGSGWRLREPASCGIVELTLRVRYPPWLSLTHAAALHARFSRHNLVVSQRVVVPLTARGQFPTLLRLGRPEELIRFFDEQPYEGTEWDAVFLRADSSDVLGLQPRELELEAAWCLGSSSGQGGAASHPAYSGRGAAR